MVTSVFNVEVDDKAFNDFEEKFQQHQEHLKDIPEAWRSIFEQVHANLGQFESMAASVAGIEANTAGILKHHTDLNRAAEVSNRGFSMLGRVTKSVSGDIKNITENLLKWASVTSVVSGLLGVGGLFGIDRLAASSSRETQRSLGFGITTGEDEAFRLNYSRYANTDSLLSNIVSAQHDPAKQYAFAAMGMGPDAVKQDPTRLATEMVIKAKEVFERGGQSEVNAQANGLLQFFTMSELRTIASRTKEQLRASQGNYERDSHGFDLDPATQEAWQNFDTQMRRAGTTIENTFIRGLVPLAGPLQHLSDSVVHLVDALMHSDVVKEGLTEIGTGIEWLANRITTPAFRQDIEDFENGVARLVHSVEDFFHGFEGVIHKLGWGTPFHPGGPGLMRDRPTGDRPDKDDPRPSVGFGYDTPGFWRYEGGQPVSGEPIGMRGVGDPAAQQQPGVGADILHWMRRAGRYVGFNQNGIDANGLGEIERGYNPATDPKRRDEFAGLEQATSLPAGLLANVYKQESDEGRDPTSRYENAAHAMGPFQETPGMASDYGVTDRNDLEQSAQGAARYLRDLTAQFGSIEKGVAAYNWGPGNLQNELDREKKLGITDADAWKKALPKETTDYLASVMRGIGANRTLTAPGGTNVSINITNGTGANVAISTNKLVG